MSKFKISKTSVTLVVKCTITPFLESISSPSSMQNVGLTATRKSSLDLFPHCHSSQTIQISNTGNIRTPSLIVVTRIQNPSCHTGESLLYRAGLKVTEQ